MAKLLKKDKLDTIENYRRQLKFYNTNKNRVIILRKKKSLLLQYYKASTKIEELVEQKTRVELVHELTEFINEFIDMDPLRLAAPLAEEGYDDQFYAIRMATPRGQDYFWDTNEMEELMSSFESVYDEVLKRFMDSHLAMDYNEITVNDETHFVVDGEKRHVAKLSLLGDELTVTTQEYKDNGNKDGESIGRADSFLDFISVYTSNKDYTYDTGDKGLDRFIRDCYPALAI